MIRTSQKTTESTKTGPEPAKKTMNWLKTDQNKPKSTKPAETPLSRP
jgi:hypothetical protein